MDKEPEPRPVAKPPESVAGLASATAGVVMLDGPGAIAASMTPDAADGTADSLHKAARDARRQSSGISA